MDHEIRITADGSPTLFVPELNEHYHSMHGAYQESMHVFINCGLLHQLAKAPDTLHILEIGLGTGLNVLLTLRELTGHTIRVHYSALEPFPVNDEVVGQIHFPQLEGNQESLRANDLIHQSEFNSEINLGPRFIFSKYKVKLEDFTTDERFHLVYFDAFSPRVQSEIWSPENFSKLFEYMQPNATLVTYCSKGDVRRAMLAAGFHVEKIPGPPGKREMLRATKLP